MKALATLTRIVAIVFIGYAFGWQAGLAVWLLESANYLEKS